MDDEGKVSSLDVAGVATVVATLKDDPAKRKASFAVTTPVANIINGIKVACFDIGEETQTSFNAEYVAGKNMLFLIKLIDFESGWIDNPTAIKAVVEDKKVASVKVNKDGTMTVKMLKPGTTKITLTATDGSEFSTDITLNLLGTDPVISTAKLTYDSTGTNRKIALGVKAAANTALSDPKIISVANGKAYQNISKYSVAVTDGELTLTVPDGLERYS